MKNKYFHWQSTDGNKKKTHLNNDGCGGHTFVIKLIKKTMSTTIITFCLTHTHAGHFSKNKMTNQEIEIEKFKEKLLL